jgi:hypothetical protein
MNSNVNAFVLPVQYTDIPPHRVTTPYCHDGGTWEVSSAMMADPRFALWQEVKFSDLRESPVFGFRLTPTAARPVAERLVPHRKRDAGPKVRIVEPKVVLTKT